MEGEIKKYIDSVIPKNIPEKRKLLLSDELESHIYDKVDRYEEIGYTTEQSIKKALEEMGEGEEVKKSISDGFDKLYHEREWWGFAAFLFIIISNIFAFILMETFSATVETGIGFALLFASFVLVCYADYKSYKTIFVGVGFGLILVLFSFISFFTYELTWESVWYGLIWFLDHHTPLCTVKNFAADDEVYLHLIWFCAVAMYCFRKAKLIHNDKIKRTRRSKVKYFAICSVFAILSVLCVVNYEKTDDYVTNSPVWFDKDASIFIIPKTEKLYENLEAMDKYEDASAYLTSNDYHETSAYADGLDEFARKNFYAQLKKFQLFDEDYEMWFNPVSDIYSDSDSYSEGGGFVFLKNDESGNLTGVGIGNGFQMYKEKRFPKDYDFGIWGFFNKEYENVTWVKDYFESMIFGSHEDEIIGFLGEPNGEVYTRFSSLVDGKKQNYYRIEVVEAYDKVNDKQERCYIELKFEDGLLTYGNLYVWKGENYAEKQSLEIVPLQ